MIRIVKWCQDHINNEKRLFCDNQEAIARINRTLFMWMLLIALAMSILLTVFSFFMIGYAPLKITYICLVLVLSLVLSFKKKIPDGYILSFFYGIILLIMAYAFYSSAVLYPESSGVFAFGVTIVLPSLILDKTPRITVIALLVMIGYLWFVIPMKAPDLHEDEIVYIISFTLVGMMMGSYLRQVRLDNVELLRLSKIREITDVLTGLHNRRKLFDYFIECESSPEGETVTGISILDIDFFKTYNDIYGHLAGDNCLKSIGACLADYGAKHDMEFYRYGGEEFVAVGHERDAERLIRSFENIVTNVAILQIPHKGNKENIITMSQGVFLLSDDFVEKIPIAITNDHEKREGKHLNGFRAQQYLTNADRALYQAKELGRNRTVFFSSMDK